MSEQQPKPTQSYFQQAQLDAEVDTTRERERAATYFGRHQTALEDTQRAYLTGSEPTSRPPVPAPAYGRDPGGADPLGYAIDDLPDMERNG